MRSDALVVNGRSLWKALQAADAAGSGAPEELLADPGVAEALGRLCGGAFRAAEALTGRFDRPEEAGSSHNLMAAGATPRHRLQCRILRPQPGAPAPVGGPPDKRRDRSIMALGPWSMERVAETTVLGDVVVHRVPQPATMLAQVEVNGQALSTIVGDGLCICTATGADGDHAKRAGAVKLSPAIDCVQLVPINPTTLAIRPLVLPASCTIAVNFRSTKRERPLSFVVDGRQVDLTSDDALELVSAPPLHTIDV